MTRYDAIIIGTGQAGPSLAAKLVGAGMSVAIIERKRFGAALVSILDVYRRKTLVASARVANMVQRAKDYGVEISGTVKVDMKKVKERKDQVSGASSQGVEKWLKEMKGCKVYEGHARFLSPKQVEVNGETLEADKIFINVGGKASTPKIPGIESVPFMNNSSMMDVDFLPEHLVILGGSYISLEFAQMYRRFGSEVTVIERGPRILSKDDEDVSDEVRKIVENEGIQVITNTGEFRVEKRGDKVAVIMQCEGKPREVEGSHFFLAVGRVHNTKDLGLDKAGVKTNERGFIEVDDQLRTNVEGIWALGDCNGKGAFTHTSYNDFEIVAANLLDNDPRKVTDRILAYNLYIDPPLGRVGMTEKQVRESKKKH